MKHKRFFVCIGAALLLMGAIFRPGCRIIVNGTAMPGVYEIDSVSRCAAAAVRTAEEITRTAEDAPFTIVPVLCLQREQPDEELLYHVLLESYAGVEKVYAVSVGDHRLGLVGDLQEIAHLQQGHPKLDIQYTQTYTYTGAQIDTETVREALRTLEEGLVGPF